MEGAPARPRVVTGANLLDLHRRQGVALGAPSAQDRQQPGGAAPPGSPGREGSGHEPEEFATRDGTETSRAGEPTGALWLTGLSGS